MDVYDLIIIGAGPAGLACAIYAGRARLKSLILEKAGPGGQIVLSSTIENYPGFAGEASTQELIQAMIKQTEGLGIQIRNEKVESIKAEDGFEVVSHDCEYKAMTVIIASGAFPKKINIPGEDEFISKGVSYCGTCDGPLYKNKDIFVVGGGDKAVEEALFLTKFANKVTLIHRRDELRASKILQERLFENKKVEILWNTAPISISGERMVRKIKLKDLKTGRIDDVAASGVFIFIGIHPNTEFTGDLIKKDERGFILTDEEMKTSLPGMFAAGDCRKKTLTQVITACSDGAIAAFNANYYLQLKS